jgi:hypothetical protein
MEIKSKALFIFETTLHTLDVALPSSNIHQGAKTWSMWGYLLSMSHFVLDIFLLVLDSMI